MAIVTDRPHVRGRKRSTKGRPYPRVDFGRVDWDAAHEHIRSMKEQICASINSFLAAHPHWIGRIGAAQYIPNIELTLWRSPRGVHGSRAIRDGASFSYCRQILVRELKEAQSALENASKAILRKKANIRLVRILPAPGPDSIIDSTIVFRFSIADHRPFVRKPGARA